MRSIAILGLIGTVIGMAFFLALAAGSRSFGRRLGGHLATDVVVCCRLTAETIIRRATRRVPASERDRYEQEWLAELDELQRSYPDGPALSLVVFAFRILLRARTTGKAWAEQRATTDMDHTPSHSEPRETLASRVSSYVSESLGLALTLVSGALTWARLKVLFLMELVRENVRFFFMAIAATAISIYIEQQVSPPFARVIGVVFSALGLVVGAFQVWTLREAKRRSRRR